LGNPFEYNGPTLMTSFVVAPPGSSEDTVLAAYDDVIADLKAKGPSTAELERVQAKMRSDWYAELEEPLSRASTLAHAVLFDGNADEVSAVPDQIASVTADEVRRFAVTYLAASNRTIIWRTPVGPSVTDKARGGRQ
jgi:zinc protease